ncbi:conserved protein of unknown function [Acetoanaerobium sticklandii]|uniref:ATP-dependent DNA helicase RecQ n=1 Tax=Acetoanaerobium sticklandii (strain ATCC 12662 / DSM 519 / JCM 1433 / CCUG 9281 / NCIMB 10654 / HF) TaxID=499177 RepID=E3PY61_ACESD|nr:RecQ family ATP-dependent DNA helicase [Acetoanaerobium sticklandii]CBH21376.1 conserved protein of unknown function [Acetoanaerobium sticklandii]
MNQQVDFYLEQAKLVIEIDGQSHKTDNKTRINDKQRDLYLAKNGIKTIRIDAKDIKRKTEILLKKIHEIKNHLSSHEEKLYKYKFFLELQKDINTFRNYESILKYTAIIRFQILILSLLEKDMLKLNDKNWILNIIERDIKDFEELALNDLFIWLEHLCKLNKLEFNRPIIKIYKSTNEKLVLNKKAINIDFSLFKRWTDENDIDEIERNKIYVRSDYFDENNYFKVSTDKPIKYPLEIGGSSGDLKSLKFILKNIFGFDNFNDGQLPVVVNSLKGEDTLGLLPTGGGKSLIYQFVGLLQPCISFIVVPIKSLMKDQRDGLDKKSIHNTNFINSSQNASEKNKIQNELGSEKYQFVWISPERFQTEEFRLKLQKISNFSNFGLAVIDEVHCLSEWGHDFRTSYLNLAKTIKEYCKGTRILGLTATASVNVLKDIMVEFDIPKENVKTKLSFTREELNFHIINDDGKNKRGKYNELIKLFKKLIHEKNDNKGSGLIFTQFVNNGLLGCFELSESLKKEFKIDVQWYSGSIPKGLKYEMRMDKFQEHQEQVQERFINDEFDWLVATKSFGMGIDKPNIRNTIHFGIPSSLESLYQEAGRAGRDKQKADCYILLSEEFKGKDYFDDIFTGIPKIEDISSKLEEHKYNSRDVFNSLFLFTSSAKDIKDEFNIIRHIFHSFAKPNYEVSISGVEDILKNKKGSEDKFLLKKSDLEKAIYKLSIIGIVKDWIIESWDEHHPQIKVTFEDYSQESIETSLIKYVNKYDKEFNFKNSNKVSSNKYFQIYKRENYSHINKMIHILLEWQYENILYHRLQSIYTVYTQCSKNQSKEEFKAYMEQYFKFDEGVFKFDYISEDPENKDLWFSLIFNEKNEILKKEELEKLDISLRRFLESFKNNTGLNFLSGIIKLLNDDYLNVDGKTRLESSFEEIQNFPEKEKDEIYEKCILISKHLDNKNKNYISELLHLKLNKNPIKTYKAINDEYSLSEVLKESTKRIRAIEGERLW